MLERSKRVRVDPPRGVGELWIIAFFTSFFVLERTVPIHLTGTLAEALFWVTVAACLVAQTALLRSAVRTSAMLSSDSSAGAPTRRSEMTWAVIPAIVIVLVLAFTWRKLHEHPQHQHAPEVGASAISS